ncbi:MAG: hypothetical protein WC774_04655 [Candidatus Gracilibacteria bacterium]|jgi:hypothetical protein
MFCEDCLKARADALEKFESIKEFVEKEMLRFDGLYLDPETREFGYVKCLAKIEDMINENKIPNS